MRTNAYRNSPPIRPTKKAEVIQACGPSMSLEGYMYLILESFITAFLECLPKLHIKRSEKSMFKLENIHASFKCSDLVAINPHNA